MGNVLFFVILHILLNVIPHSTHIDRCNFRICHFCMTTIHLLSLWRKNVLFTPIWLYSNFNIKIKFMDFRKITKYRLIKMNTLLDFFIIVIFSRIKHKIFLIFCDIHIFFNSLKVLAECSQSK